MNQQKQKKALSKKNLLLLPSLLGALLSLMVLLPKAGRASVLLGIIRDFQNTDEWNQVIRRIDALGISYEPIDLRQIKTVDELSGVRVIFLPNIEVHSFESALVLAIVLGFLNTFLKPILILLTLPVTVLSLGLFLLILNAIIVFTTAYFVSGFIVSSWLGAILFGVLMTLADSLIRGLIEDD